MVNEADLVEAPSFLFGPFLEPPTPRQRDEFREFILATGRPEQLAALKRTPPDLLKKHQLVCRFHVERTRRPDGDFIPCCICHDQPKFLEGAILWSEDGWLRLVGHCCADRYFGGSRFREMLAEHQFRQQLESDEDWLLGALPRVRLLLKRTGQFGSLAKSVQSQMSSLHRDGPKLAATLRRIIDNGSGLTVIRHVDSDFASMGFRSSSGTASEQQEIVIGRLIGREFLTPAFRPHNEISSLTLQLEQIGCDTDQDALELVCSRSSSEVIRMAAGLRALIRKGPRLEAKIHQAARFMDLKNIEQLRRWAVHPDNHLPLNVRIEGFRCCLQFEDREVIWLTLNSTPLEPLADWPTI